MAGLERLENSNPMIFSRVEVRKLSESELNEDEVDPIDAREIFDIIRNINDPEHPLTLEELNVVDLEALSVVDDGVNPPTVTVMFTPTIPHCSMATLIGLSLRAKLSRSLPSRFKIDVRICEGTHVNEQQVNKQLNDKERVAAALENKNLLDVVNQCLSNEKDAAIGR